jgi:hypothetical protein
MVMYMSQNLECTGAQANEAALDIYGTMQKVERGRGGPHHFYCPRGVRRSVMHSTMLLALLVYRTITSPALFCMYANFHVSTEHAYIDQAYLFPLLHIIIKCS